MLKVLIQRPFPSPLEPAEYDWFTKVEALRDGVVVLDGYQINAEALEIGSNLRYVIQKPNSKQHFGREAHLRRLAVDSWELDLRGFTELTDTVRTPPDDVEHSYNRYPQYPIFPAGETEAPQTITGTHPGSRAVSVETLQYAARYAHNQLNVWYERVIALQRGHSSRQRDAGHDFLYEAQRWLYLMCVRIPTAFENLTLKRRIDACYLLATGASDVTTPEEFYKSSITAGPTSPAAWVNPKTSTPHKLPLGEVIVDYTDDSKVADLSEYSELDKDFQNAGWIDEIVL